MAGAKFIRESVWGNVMLKSFVKIAASVAFAIAALPAAGQIQNVDPNQPASVAATIDGAAVRSATGQVLTAAAVDAHNSFDRPNEVVPRPFGGRISGGQLLFDLPPKSVAVVELR